MYDGMQERLHIDSKISVCVIVFHHVITAIHYRKCRKWLCQLNLTSDFSKFILCCYFTLIIMTMEVFVQHNLLLHRNPRKGQSYIMAILHFLKLLLHPVVRACASWLQRMGRFARHT